MILGFDARGSVLHAANANPTPANNDTTADRGEHQFNSSVMEYIILLLLSTMGT